MKNLKRILTFTITCVLLIIGTVIFSQAAEITLPSETSAFVTNVYIGATDQNASLIDDIYPVMKAKIKENNKKPLTPYYEKFAVLNNPENFQGLGHATYANINGKTVTAEAFYRRKNESVRDPNVGQGLLIFQCLQYKAAHPEEDVEPPDSQEFENMLDEAAEGFADEDVSFDNEDLGDYEDMGDFDYLEEADVDAEEMEDVTDAEVSPDSGAEDIGEIVEEIGEVAEEAEAIIAALL